MVSTIVFLIGLLSSISVALGGSIYCVKPRDLSVKCGNAHLCEDLHYYVSNAGLYISNDTTLEFLPGEHFLAGEVSISDVRNLKLTGEVKACSTVEQELDKMPQVTCRGEAGFIFQGSQNLTISSLSFTHCGQSVLSTLYTRDFGEVKASLVLKTWSSIPWECTTAVAMDS